MVKIYNISITHQTYCFQSKCACNYGYYEDIALWRKVTAYANHVITSDSRMALISSEHFGQMSILYLCTVFVFLYEWGKWTVFAERVLQPVDLSVKWQIRQMFEGMLKWDIRIIHLKCNIYIYLLFKKKTNKVSRKLLRRVRIRVRWMILLYWCFKHETNVPLITKNDFKSTRVDQFEFF